MSRIVFVALIAAIAWFGPWRGLLQTSSSPLRDPFAEMKTQASSDDSDTANVDLEVVFVTTTWCPHCKSVPPLAAIVRERFPNMRVREVDAEARENASLVAFLHTRSYPRTYILSDRQVIWEAGGTPSSDEMISQLKAERAKLLRQSKAQARN